MLRAFLLIGKWLRDLGLDPKDIRVTVRFPSMRDRIQAESRFLLASHSTSAGRFAPKGGKSTIYGIPVEFTDPTDD